MRLKILTWFVTRYAAMRAHHSLSVFGRLLDDPYLFHLNERSVPGAFAVGLFCAWIPLPFQMFIAVPAAVVARVNVPLSVILVWISNPLTIPPMFYFAYLVGAWLSGADAQPFEFEPSVGGLLDALKTIGEPFLLGCFVTGSVSALIGYTAMKWLWHERLSRLLHLLVQRRQRRRAGRADAKTHMPD